MKKLNDLLGSGDLFSVDMFACMSHAETLKNHKQTIQKQPWNIYPAEIQLIFKVAFISICHQINWDYLQHTLAQKILTNEADILDILQNVSAKKISCWLEDYPRKERVRAQERATLIKDVGIKIASEFNSDLKLFYSQVSNATLAGNQFEKIMDTFEAYRKDPLKKKTNVLTHDLTTEKIIDFRDKENLKPAVDYHIIRTYLRTGRVIPKDTELFKFFKGAPNPRNYIIKKLRETVSEAVMLTAHYAGINVAEINYIEWQIGRNACTNKDPICKNERPNNLPLSIKKLSLSACPYEKECLAFNRIEEFIEFEEPIFITSHY